jgi:N-acetylmuramoyl-L-alanine amidase
MRAGGGSRPTSSQAHGWNIASRLVRSLLALTLAAGFSAAIPALAQSDIEARRASAQEQFERAEALRASVESKPERERSVRDYEEIVTAYRRVYLITPNAVPVPAAIKDVADLYRHMGEQFEPKYFNLAIETYEFLVHDYPASSLRDDALLAIADIRKNSLSQSDRSQLDLAQKNYEDFLQQYPHSPLVPHARKALEEMEAARKLNAAREEASAARERGSSKSMLEKGAVNERSGAPNAQPGVAVPHRVDAAAESAPGENSEVSQVRVWNADNYTRIIIELGGKAKYQAARISDPDRIYFDIDNARLSSELLREPIAVPPGSYLKSVRVAQNRADVVRVVLDVARVKDYSVFELADPDRLVVDVYGPGAATIAKANSAPAASAAAVAKANPKPAAANAAAVRTAAPAAPPKIGSLPLLARSTSALTVAPVPPRVEAQIGARVEARSETGSAESTRAMANSGPAQAASPTRSGERSLTRVLGLKIGRIVIDPGHGGHDTGTIGPTGLIEKDLCLDVALRLGKLIEQKLPSEEIVFTRHDDKYVGLEQRTAIANGAKADLFVSIHANSSDDASVRGIETYYLNFNASPQAMGVAARENATAQRSVHDLQDLVTKIAENDKAEESRDLAADIQDSVAASMQVSNRAERNRGVRKAPFVVLIGADMPSVLAEISFISNPTDEQLLKKPENRQRVAEGLFQGIEKYLRSVNSLSTRVSPLDTPEQ